MSQFEFNLIVVLGVIGFYLFIRSVFGLSHKVTIITIIISMIGAFIGISSDGHQDKGNNNG